MPVSIEKRVYAEAAANRAQAATAQVFVLDATRVIG